MPKYGFMECLDNKKKSKSSKCLRMFIFTGFTCAIWNNQNKMDIERILSLSLSLNKQAELVSNNNGVTFFSTKNGCPSSSQ